METERGPRGSPCLFADSRHLISAEPEENDGGRVICVIGFGARALRELV